MEGKCRGEGKDKMSELISTWNFIFAQHLSKIKGNHLSDADRHVKRAFLKDVNWYSTDNHHLQSILLKNIHISTCLIF